MTAAEHGPEGGRPAGGAAARLHLNSSTLYFSMWKLGIAWPT
ncbi:MAG TPA: hypothetical protein VGV06_14050 [Methylomirabilota bacterium]|nr:hypothetical protein [Methylomirabilota bacterium]